MDEQPQLNSVCFMVKCHVSFKGGKKKTILSSFQAVTFSHSLLCSMGADQNMLWAAETQRRLVKEIRDLSVRLLIRMLEYSCETNTKV